MNYLERIRGLREDKDLTQKDVGAILHIPANTYSQYERGRSSIPILLLTALCEFYHISADYLLGRCDKNLMKSKAGVHTNYLERMRSLRNVAGLNQTQIGEVLHIAQTTYSQYELGSRSIPIPLLIELCDFYSVSADYLLGLSDKKEPNR